MRKLSEFIAMARRLSADEFLRACAIPVLIEHPPAQEPDKPEFQTRIASRAKLAQMMAQAVEAGAGAVWLQLGVVSAKA